MTLALGLSLGGQAIMLTLIVMQQRTIVQLQEKLAKRRNLKYHGPEDLA